MGASGVGFHAFLELLPGAEGDHGAGGDRDLLAGLGVAAGALVLAAQVEIAEARQLDLATGLQALAQGVEERIDEFLGLRSEEHTSELQSLMRTSYAVFCLKKKKQTTTYTHNNNNTKKQLLT